MADQISPERRSAVMARIAGKNTGPEMRVRKAAHALGLRFRLHRKDLPGKPDLVLPKHQAAVMVHGCFWHRHEGCRRASSPKSNTGYWGAKLDRNVARDQRNAAELERLGWRVVVIWECETKNPESLGSILRQRLLPEGSAS